MHRYNTRLATSSSTNPSNPLHIGLNSQQIANVCKRSASGQEVRKMSILAGGVPSPPEHPMVPLRKEQLYPLTPSMEVYHREEAFGARLQQFCFENQITVIRGLISALKLDLDIFSTRTLVQANPHHPIDERWQFLQSAAENKNAYGKRVWKLDSESGQTTLENYAVLQDSSVEDSGNQTGRRRVIRFGTNLDLSDREKWNNQQLELQKLPPFLKVNSAGNMLSHVGHDLLGMNTVQCYVKVPGSRTPGHQENNNYCSVNVNIGPGDCEWFAVPMEYWGVIEKLCEINGLDYLSGSWWPNLKDLARERVPVHRFIQKAGDIVWVNCGCVHWVQSLGVTNNIAWNTGPITGFQYKLALERYEWNKEKKFVSIVPMVRLSWNLARNISTTDRQLFTLIKTTLMKTLAQCFKLLKFAERMKIAVEFHGRTKDEAAHYCDICREEIFNLLIIRPPEGRGRQTLPCKAHCVDCARTMSPNLAGFIILEEYPLEVLMKIYDNFILRRN